ncbi:MAG: YeeE/YedE thiosulfate transporter family protein [Verrucomicrobiales bacterium]|nr:YeeE/YedE thiosulfate transporter family protein [Verrucomicrobiales bacterium]
MTDLTKPQDSKSSNLQFGLLFGIVFGFLLQKGGVGKFHVLIGQLLLEDWTVVKIMVSAVIVGMIGLYTLHSVGRVELHIKATKLGPNIIGGLLFGSGFALAAYCPGTNIAALGQGNWDAVVVAMGLIAGSYLFAEMSSVIGRTIDNWGDYGKLTLPEVTHLPARYLVPLLVVILTALLWAVEKLN